MGSGGANPMDIRLLRHLFSELPRTDVFSYPYHIGDRDARTVVIGQHSRNLSGQRNADCIVQLARSLGYVSAISVHLCTMRHAHTSPQLSSTIAVWLVRLTIGAVRRLENAIDERLLFSEEMAGSLALVISSAIPPFVRIWRMLQHGISSTTLVRGHLSKSSMLYS